jgi:ribosomal protein S18 acetylase RimI-like enzyme
LGRDDSLVWVGSQSTHVDAYSQPISSIWTDVVAREGAMQRGQRQGVVVGLSTGDRASVERLLVTCNEYEELDLPIVLEPAATLGDTATAFLYYDVGTPVGFAWLPDDPEPEACLMVHPTHRRRGIGRALLVAARSECRRRGLPGFMLVCDEAARSGRAFVKAVGGSYRSAEYRMELDRGAIDRSRPHQDIALRLAGVDDAASLVRMLSASFGSPEESVREQVDRWLNEPRRRYYLATLSGEPVGMLQTGSWEEGTAGITALNVLPDYRGRGIGRQMLLDAVDALVADGWKRILIEVATDNEGALGLYQFCGFRVTTKYGFYDLVA